MNKMKTFDELKSEISDCISKANTYQELIKGMNGACSIMNDSYHIRSNNVDWDRPNHFLHITPGQKLVIHEGRIWLSEVRYKVHIVYDYFGEMMLWDACNTLLDVPPQIEDQKVNFFAENGFKIKGYIVKAAENLNPLEDLENPPKNLEEAESAMRSCSVEGVIRPLGNIYYDKDGQPCAQFEEPKICMDVWGRLRGRQSVDKPFGRWLGLLGIPNNKYLQSHNSETALTQVWYYVQFEPNKAMGVEHITHIVLEAFKGDEPEHHLKFEYWLAENRDWRDSK